MNDEGGIGGIGDTDSRGFEADDEEIHEDDMASAGEALRSAASEEGDGCGVAIFESIGPASEGLCGSVLRGVEPWTVKDPTCGIGRGADSESPANISVGGLTPALMLPLLSEGDDERRSVASLTDVGIRFKRCAEEESGEADREEEV